VIPRCILVVGSGGREHALAWRLARDPESPEVLVAPGKEGMEDCARRLAVEETDGASLAEACRREGVDLVVIGPERPLAAGVAGELAEAGVRVFGPGREGARLESSKWYAKQVMREGEIPTAAAEEFADLEQACRALERFGPPWVVKADGLAAGKGVRVTDVREEAEAFLADCLERGRFGDGGRRVLLEEFLEGEEASLMAVCDGRGFVVLPAARDYKRAFDGDLGPNTGGMGAYAPSDWLDEGLERWVGREVIEPVLRVMRRRGAPFRGTLYCGLMWTRGGPKVVEFNVRFGDPETQVVLPLLEGSLGRLLASAADGALEGSAVWRTDERVVAVALADEGYPEAVRGKGVVTGLDRLHGREALTVFHAGTRRTSGGWEVCGGRAAYVVARGETREVARARAYGAIGELGGRGWRVRGDIAAARPGAPGGSAIRGLAAAAAPLEGLGGDGVVGELPGAASRRRREGRGDEGA
jgi:phosphoribosylamine--glycine ligase